MKPNLEFRIKQGVFLALAAAFFILPWVFPALRNHAPGVAVICGVIFAVAWGNPFEALTAKLTSPLLGAAIVGMGFGMNLVEVLKAGAHGLVISTALFPCPSPQNMCRRTAVPGKEMSDISSAGTNLRFEDSECSHP